MQTINIKDLKYENKLFKTGAEATIYKSNLGLFKEFNITTPEYVRENKRRKLLELVKIDSIKKYYNEIICLVNDTNNEFLTGYVVKKSNGFPLDEIFLLQNEKIIILKKLKNILSTLEKNDVIYEDIHFNNIYYDKATDKLELIDIDNIKIGNYCQDLETFLMEKYYY